MSQKTAPTLQRFLSNIIGNGGVAKANRFNCTINTPRILLDSSYSTYVNRMGLPGVSTSPLQISQSLVLQCEIGEMPGKQFQTQDWSYFNLTNKTPTKIVYSDISLTFICTNSYNEKAFFDIWMESIMPFNAPSVSIGERIPLELAYPSNMMGEPMWKTTITITQFDEGGQSGVVSNGIESGPLDNYGTGMNKNEDVGAGASKEIYSVDILEAWPIAMSPLAKTWSDDQAERLQVTFAYVRWRMKNPNEIIRESTTGISGIIDKIF